MTKISWHIEQRQVNELVPYHKNPRDITEQGLKDLNKSIDKFGLAEPIVINKETNIIIGGHARWLTLKEQNIKECDCYVPNRKLSDKEVEELNIRLNKNIAGVFDFDILANEFELPDLLEWGFEEKELDINLWNDKTDEELDDAPEPQKEAISKLGDIFVIDGKHRVMCGDSTNSGHVSDLCAKNKANLYFTDPPYGVDYASKNQFLNNYDKGNRIQKDISGDKEIGFIESVFKNAKENLENGAVYYIFSGAGGELMRMMMMMMMNAGLEPKHMIVWVKNNHVLGRTDYNYKHEPIHYGWLGSHKFYGNGEQRFSVWNYNKPLKNDLHPTMKPIALIINAILNSTLSNCIVLDTFLGSGSTLIACEQTNRICYGMEIDPIYIDVILRRYHKLYPDKKIECTNRKFDFEKLWQTDETKE